MVGKAIDTQAFAIGNALGEVRIAGKLLFGDLTIKAFEQATVKEGHLAEQSQGGIGIGEQVLITIEAVDHMVPVLPPATSLRTPLAAFAHLSVERGKKQVLQDGPVVIAFVQRLTGIVLEQGAYIREPEQCFWDQPAFLDEPAEYHAGEQSD